jgi:hypothetical protein
VRIETSPDGQLVWTGITDIVDSTNIPVPQGRQNVAAGLIAADIKLSTLKKTNLDAQRNSRPGPFGSWSGPFQHERNLLSQAVQQPVLESVVLR